MKRKLFLTAWLLAAAATGWAQGPNGSEDYYKAADGKKGAELKTALCEVINPHIQRTYAQLWTDFKTTDAKDNGKVWDMYSNLREMTFGTDQAGNYKKEGDVYNREHSFPKSWFNDEYPMYTDLFHLYPTDGWVNNERGNDPFGEVGGTYKSSANEFSKWGSAKSDLGYSGKVFEPNDEYKGDFARTYFYMVTCYESYTNSNNVSRQITSWNCPMLDGKTYPGLTNWALRMLLKWSMNDPVSEKEINRNKAVYGIQNNRNPFIDYPGLEQYIWGSATDKPFSYDNYQQVEGTTDVDPAGGDDDDPGSSTLTDNEIALNNAFFSINSSGTIAKSTSEDFVGSANGVTVVYALGDGGQRYANDSEIRVYTGNTLTISVAEGTITKIEITLGKNNKGLSCTPGSIADNTWTGNAKAVTITASNTSIAKIKVTVAGKTTGIDTPTKARSKSTIYNMRGERVTDPTHGIYIVDGKKVIY